MPLRAGRLESDILRKRPQAAFHEAWQAGPAGRRVDGQNRALDLRIDCAGGDGGGFFGFRSGCRLGRGTYCFVPLWSVMCGLGICGLTSVNDDDGEVERSVKKGSLRGQGAKAVLLTSINAARWLFLFGLVAWWLCPHGG